MENQYTYFGSVHLLFVDRGKILLLKRANTGYQDGKWSLVAGRMDGNEEVKSAAIREAKEEVDVTILPQNIEITGMYHRKSDNGEWFDFFLNVKQWDGSIHNNEPDKCAELRWFSLDELPEEIIPHIKDAILRDQPNLWFESYGWQ